MPRYLSNRVKRTPQGSLSDDRYRYLDLKQAEPNLGDPAVPGETIPVGTQYQVISLLERPGERFWIPVGGGLIPGSITIFEEGIITPPGGISSITQLNFVGNSIKAQGFLLPSGNPGTAVTITVSPPGNNGEVLFKELGDFSTSPSLVFNGSVGILTIGNGLNVGAGGTLFTIKPTGLVGINTINPTQELHVQGDLRLTGTIYDFGNQPGLADNILIKNNFGGLTWINQSSIRAGAGGTYTNVQYHNASGLVDGANNFVYDPINSRVGIGSTLPRYLLDVLGTVNVIGLVTTTNLYVSGISTFNGVVNIISTQPSINTTTGSLVISGGVGIAQNLNVGGTLNVTGITTLNTTNIASLTSQQLNVTGISTLNTTSTTNLTSQQLNVTGISTLNTTSTTNLTSQQLNVSGIATIGSLNSDNNTLQNLKVTGITTLGIAEIEQTLRVFGNTTLSNTSTTNLTSQQLNVTGISTLNTTSTTNLTSQQLNVSGIATISTLSVTNTVFQSLNVTGIATISTLGVTGLTTTRNLRVIGVGTFDGLLDANGGATIDNIQIGISGDNEIDTSTGNLTIDSAGGTTTIDDNLVVSGTSTFNGNVTLGDASTDIVSFTSRVGTGITPSTNGTLDLGSSLNKWNNVYANAFVGAVIGNADTAAQVSVATTTGISSYFLTFADSNNASRLNEFLYTDAGISYNPSTDLLSASNLIVSGISTFEGTSTFNGNVTLGNATTDTVTFTARVNSNVLPSTNGTLDLGGTLNKWNNIYANAFIGAINGNADTSSQISVGTTTGILSYFLTFVNSNNATRDNEFLYTDAGISYNPSTDLLTLTNLSVTGITTLTGLLDANGAATIDNVRIGVAGDNEIDTSTGNLILDSASGITTIDDNLIVSGISTFQGNVTLGDATTDTVTFTARVNSNVLPSTNGTLDLGGTLNRWSTIYATTFNGAITGNADTATKLATVRNIAITGDLSWNVNFDGSTNVTSIGTLANSGVTAATYGSSTTVPVFAVDAKGRVTSVTNTGINFAAATVSQSDSVRTISNTTSNASFYPTFVDSNNAVAAYESLYTDAGISYNPFTDLLTVSNLTVSGISTFNGNTTLGDATTDTVTFNARVNSSVLPSTNGTLDLGSSLNKWNVVYSNSFVGAITGNADTATKLATARNFSITGDVDAPTVSFDGTGNVNLVTTLDNTGVVASTYGSSTTVPVFAVDSKGRITSVTNTGINFAAATVSQSDSVRTISNTTSNASFYPTFVDSNNAVAAYESLYTDAGISYNPFTDLLSLTNLSVSGNTTLGDAATDTVIFTGRINSSVLPFTNGTFDLGGASNKWNNIYANTFVGAITGNADTASRLATARTITITGDLSWSVSFDGSANVTSTGTLANTGVTAATYGSSSTVPVFTVDSKGRITSVTNTGISGINASSVSAAGLNTQVQFNDNGFFAGNANFTFNKTTNVLTVPTVDGDVTGCTFSDDAVNKANITTRTDSGFYEHDTATTAEGWPITSNTWMHMIACTHSNNANYYSMQIAASFFNQTDLYYRSTNANGATGWSKIWHSNNDGSGSGLDADLLDGLNSSTSTAGNTIVARDGNGDDFRRYGFGSYFNSSDDVSGGTITYIMAKFGDNYYRSATAAKVATFISGQSMNISGNATTATSATFLNSSNYIQRTGSSGNLNTDFQNTPAGSTRIQGDDANLTNSPGGTWWFYQNMRHSNGSSFWGTQVAWGWEDNANRLRTRNVQNNSFGGWVSYWNDVNDGAGSGLDADLLDGINSSSFARVDSSSIFTVPTLFQSNLGATSGALSNPPLQAYSTGNNSAFMSFHKSGIYAVNFGLDSDNVLRIGGWSAAADRWQLDMSGNMTAAGTVTANSDIRLKENIEVISNPLEKISQIRGVTFTRNDQDDKKRKHVGVIAQEVEKVLPEVVMEDRSGIKSVAYGNLVGLLIESIKEQQTQIKAQQTQINNLTDIINKLQK